MPAHSNSIGQQFYDPLWIATSTTVSTFYQADEFRTSFALWAPGVSNATTTGVTPSGGSFTVTPASLMNVTVSPGVALVMGGNPATADPNSKVTSQGNYLVQLGSSTTVSTTPATGSTRYDQVVLQVLDANISGVLSEAQVYVIQGTPGSPVSTSVPNSCLLLATLRIDPSTTTIASGNITEQRVVALPIGLGGSTSGANAYTDTKIAALLSANINPLQAEADATKHNLAAILTGAGGLAATEADLGVIGGAAPDSLVGVLRALSGTTAPGGTHLGVVGFLQVVGGIGGVVPAGAASPLVFNWTINGVAAGVSGPFITLISSHSAATALVRTEASLSGTTLTGVIGWYWAGTSNYNAGSNGTFSIVVIGYVPNGGAN